MVRLACCAYRDGGSGAACSLPVGRAGRPVVRASHTGALDSQTSTQRAPDTSFHPFGSASTFSTSRRPNEPVAVKPLPDATIVRSPAVRWRTSPDTTVRIYSSRWSSSFCDPESHASHPQSGESPTATAGSLMAIVTALTASQSKPE